MKSILCDFYKNVFGGCNYILCIIKYILERKNLCLEAMAITESSAYNFAHLMLGGIFHGIASGSDPCKPCFSLPHILPVLGFAAHILILT